MKILLVGGFGFIGKRIIRKLFSTHDLIVFARERSIKKGGINNLENLEIEKGIIEDDRIYQVIEKHKPDVVIHLAALTSLRKCEENPFEAFKTNVYGTANVVTACVKGKSRLIFLSSREVYGETINNSSSEDACLLPNNTYGMTKMLAESLVQYAGKKNNLNYTILRLTNVYGPEGDKGVNVMIKNAINDKKIKVFGGDQVVNLVYVDDIVKIIKLVLKSNHSSKQIFNVGSNDSLPIQDLAHLISHMRPTRVKIEFYPRPYFETVHFIPNLNKLKNILKFCNPTKIKSGLEKTINWHN